MKIFAIRDELDLNNKNLAYLLYYEKEKRFYIELPDDADPWETPLFLDAFVKRGEKTVSAYYSKLWVQQRIVPTDRQNLGHILKENGLESYDEYELLMLAEGRCAQDDYYLVPVTEDELSKEFVKRYEYKVEDVVPLSSNRLLVFFRNGITRKCDIDILLKNDKKFTPIIRNEGLFATVSVAVGGYGICWGENLFIQDEVLYRTGENIPLRMEDFCSFVANWVINTAEAADILECTRQNIDDLIKRGKLHPIKTDAKGKWFLKTEVLHRNWK